uniref:Kappa-casein n=1 Tax=Cacopsylla melanoneura TaxID=428564 RepID=A0A8D8M9D3_9HEMI
MNELNRVTLLVTVVAWLSNIQPSLAQGYQPIVHYVLTPVEIFRIPRTDYQPQIQVVPQEEFGPLVLNHPSNEYFRNLLINPVSYDSVMPLSPTPVTIIPVPAVPCPETLADKKTIRTPSEDIDILNNTITTDTNTTAAENEAMIARIIDDTIDTSNGTDADDETDDGSVEATTPRLRSEEKELNKTERIVSSFLTSAPTPHPDVSGGLLHRLRLLVSHLAL